jgi:hypothetical protein
MNGTALGVKGSWVRIPPSRQMRCLVTLAMAEPAFFGVRLLSFWGGSFGCFGGLIVAVGVEYQVALGHASIDAPQRNWVFIRTKAG